MSGQGACYRRVFTQDDFDRFARLSGDDNPIHCDPAFARTSHFGATVSHGMLLYACISKGFAELIPGPGAVQLAQELMFPNPTFVGDEITVALEVAVTHDDGTLELDTTVSKMGDNGAVITAQGRAHVAPRGVRADGVPRAVRGEALLAEDATAGDAQLYGLRPGMTASATRRFLEADLDEYSDLTGDRNPLFRDDEAARAAGFERRVVPPALLAGMYSDLFGTRLPGRGTGWMKQKMTFLAPAHAGTALTARVEITRLRATKELVNLRSTISDENGHLVCAGESLVLVRNLENKSSASGRPA